MKRLYFVPLLIHLLFFSSFIFAQQDSARAIVKSVIKKNILIEDGKGDTILVEYRYTKGLNIDSSILTEMLYKTSIEAQLNCKNHTSFKPYKKSSFIILWLNKDQAYHITFNFLAQNSYGAEGEVHIDCTFDKNYKFIDSFLY